MTFFFCLIFNREFLYQKGFKNEWEIREIHHPLQRDAVSCGVYVLKVKLVTSGKFNFHFIVSTVTIGWYVVCCFVVSSASLSAKSDTVQFNSAK